jgi:hypothetical protein
MTLPSLEIPSTLNYVGAFLTLGCNLGCTYCINDPAQAGQRKRLFPLSVLEMPPERWIAGLSRLPSREDLPITLQGGEPTLYWRGRGLGEMLAGLDHKFDLLTNLAQPPAIFAERLAGQQEKLRRAAPYPSIRVSYHKDEMERLWAGRGLETLVERCLALAEHGFMVSPDKATSDIGIYMVAHPDKDVGEAARRYAASRVPFETKEFLGVHDGVLYGTYLYPFSTDLIARNLYPKTLSVECRTSELLIDPLGFVWGCHFHLYDCWAHGGPRAAYAALEANDFRYLAMGRQFVAGTRNRPIGHILDPDFRLDTLQVFRGCESYGQCIGCDTKVKNDRFQSLYDREQPHTAVEIRNIDMPPELLMRLDDAERRRIQPFLDRSDRVA